MSRRPMKDADRATYRNLTRARAAQSPDGLVHLPLRDGSTITGRLRGATADAIYLHDLPSVAARDLA